MEYLSYTHTKMRSATRQIIRRGDGAAGADWAVLAQQVRETGPAAYDVSAMDAMQCELDLAQIAAVLGISTTSRLAICHKTVQAAQCARIMNAPVRRVRIP